MMNSKCQICGRAKDWCSAVHTGKADVLLKMCSETKKLLDERGDEYLKPVKPNMKKFNALIKAGAPIRTVVRSQRERQRTVRGRCESVMEAQIDGICIEIPDVG